MYTDISRRHPEYSNCSFLTNHPECYSKQKQTADPSSVDTEVLILDDQPGWSSTQVSSDCGRRGVVLDGYLYLFGNVSSSNNGETSEHLARGALSAVGDEEQCVEVSADWGRRDHSINAIEKDIVVFGGVGPNGVTNDVQLFSPHRDAPERYQHSVPTLLGAEDVRPCPRSCHASFVYGDMLVIHGGIDASGQPLADLWCLRILRTERKRGRYTTVVDVRVQWTQPLLSGSQPGPSSGHCLVSFGHRVFAYGLSNSRARDPAIYQLDMDKLHWTKLQLTGAPLPAVLNTSGVVVNNVVIFCSADSNAMRIFDPWRLELTSMESCSLNAQYAFEFLVGDMFVDNKRLVVLSRKYQSESITFCNVWCGPFYHLPHVSLPATRFREYIMNIHDYFAPDAFLLVGGERVGLHQSFLRCRSAEAQHLLGLFEGGRVEHCLEHVEPHIVKAAVRFLYSEDIQVDPSQLQRLHEFAVRFSMNRLASLCKLKEASAGFLLYSWQPLVDDLYAALQSCETDLILQVDSVDFRCHRFILAARSPFLRAVLTTGFKEAHQSTIELQEVSAQAMEAVLCHIYTDEAPLQPSTASEVLCAAKHLGLERLVLQTEQYIVARLGPKNVAAVADLALMVGAPYLLQMAQRYFHNHRRQAVKSHTFRTAPPELKERLLEFSRTRTAPKPKAAVTEHPQDTPAPPPEATEGSHVSEDSVANFEQRLAALELEDRQQECEILGAALARERDFLASFADRSPCPLSSLSDACGTPTLCLSRHPSTLSTTDESADTQPAPAQLLRHNSRHQYVRNVYECLLDDYEEPTVTDSCQ